MLLNTSQAKAAEVQHETYLTIAGLKNLWVPDNLSHP